MVYALLPIAAFAVWQFGISALVLILTVTASCLLTEHLFNRAGNKPNTLRDWSATITGLLLALTLPPGFPLWMGAVAGFIAIALGKTLFGGLGYNVFNPALVGRAFVQAAFPVAITTWTPAFAPGRFNEFIPSTLAFPFTTPPSVSEWSKSAVDAFSRVLAEELRPHGVRVGVLVAGAVDTPLWDTVGSSPPREKMLRPQDVARAAVLMAALPPHASLEELTLLPAGGIL